mgnify:CR=1 FL=1
MFAEHYKFHEPLHLEFLKIERKRAGIILVLFLISSVLIPVLHHLSPNLLRASLNNKKFVDSMLFWWMISVELGYLSILLRF